MLEQFRLLLIIPSAILFLYGGWQFWSGKQSVEEKRRTAKPRVVTLGYLALNPPRKNGEWYQITDGGASLSHAILMDTPGSASKENAPFFLFAPILSRDLTDKPQTMNQFMGKRPFAQIVLRTQNKEYKATYKTLLTLRTSDTRTVDSWIAQNHRSLVIKPPFTGTLIRRSTSPIQDRVTGGVHAEYPKDGWILLEGKRPNIADNAQLALGLCLMMGVPTVWMFGLLFAGKLDPPDEEPLPGARPVAEPDSVEPAVLAMTSAMPVAPEETQTKTPRR